MRRCWERLLLILMFATPEIAELGSALAAVCVGAWLLLPGELFARYPVFFRPMAQMAPERVWGAGLILVGLYQLGKLICGTRGCRRGAALSSLTLWVFLAVMYLRADWRSLGVPLWFLGAVANAWVYWRTSGWWRSAEDGTA